MQIIAATRGQSGLRRMDVSMQRVSQCLARTVIRALDWMGNVSLAFLTPAGMPITFGAFGFVLGHVEAVLFNALARVHGGLDIIFSK
ncbi:MAG: hypothetical protein OEQ28_13855 [Acidobacteriota bacterium]|nr:hypothetical protein [Acidobacteriota bacterium]